MASTLNYERVASIIVEAIYNGDKATCTKWDITQRSLQRYRKLAGSDEDLSRFVAIKSEAFQEDWSGSAANAIRNASRFIDRAAEEAEVNAENITAMAEALKVLTEAHTIAKMTNERIRQIRADTKEDKPQPSITAGDDENIINGEVIEDSGDTETEQSEPDT